MPEPPPVGLFTRFVLENVWPAAAVGLLAGGLLLWFGLREGRSGQRRTGAALILAAAAVVLTGVLVRTSGERARVIVRDLVDATASNDLVAVDALLAPSARLAAGSPRNPGFAKPVILEQAGRLRDEFRVESNRVSMLKAYSASSARAEVHVACWTEFASGLFPTPSQWVLVVERQGDGSWQVTQITCISVAGRSASPEWWR
ncbi:MAG: hypothetical protein ACYTGG_02470 [Planctomycetota bacterium]|jgi:hypothetical protein